MSTEMKSNEREDKKRKIVYRGSASDAVYGLGLIGAWLYYFTTASSFGTVILGFLKGLVWPAMVVFELMKFLNM